MIQVLHNPRCSKSRATINYLTEENIDFETREYLKNELNKEELQNILELLGIEPIELIRKNESIWKENFKNKELTNEQLIDAMVEFPKLIERPIVINNGKAVVARPTERIEEVI